MPLNYICVLSVCTVPPFSKNSTENLNINWHGIQTNEMERIFPCKKLGAFQKFRKDTAFSVIMEYAKCLSSIQRWEYVDLEELRSFSLICSFRKLKTRMYTPQRCSRDLAQHNFPDSSSQPLQKPDRAFGRTRRSALSPASLRRPLGC